VGKTSDFKDEIMRTSLHMPLIDGRRDRRIGELIGVIWLLSHADLGFTLWAQFFTTFKELNPLAAVLLREGMIGSLILMKILLTAIGVTVFWRLRTHMRTELALWLMVAVYVMLTFRWSGYTIGMANVVTQ